MGCIRSSLSLEDKLVRKRNFTEEEVVRALKDMRPTKAPGPDGFHAIIFHKNWCTVGLEVANACLGVLSNGNSIRAINSTNIVLISNKKDPKKVADFHPITLYNVIYKLVTKNDC